MGADSHLRIRVNAWEADAWRYTLAGQTYTWAYTPGVADMHQEMYTWRAEMHLGVYTWGRIYTWRFISGAGILLGYAHARADRHLEIYT